jgi:hypothetical protein
MLQNQYWVLRQNYAEKTDQTNVRDLIISQQFVSCPWGGWGQHRKNVVNGTYNDNPTVGRSAGGQDRRVVEEMQIGDIVLVPFAGQSTCILARIVGPVEYAIDTGLSAMETDGVILLGSEGEPFYPVGRRIEILNAEYPKPAGLQPKTISKTNLILNVNL